MVADERRQWRDHRDEEQEREIAEHERRVGFAPSSCHAQMPQPEDAEHGETDHVVGELAAEFEEPSEQRLTGKRIRDVPVEPQYEQGHRHREDAVGERIEARRGKRRCRSVSGVPRAVRGHSAILVKWRSTIESFRAAARAGLLRRPLS